MDELAAVLGDRRRWMRDLAIAVAMVLVLGPMGPFGGFAEPLSKRMAIAASYSFSAVLIWSPGFPLLLWLFARLRTPPALAWALAALVIAAPIAAVVPLVATLVWKAGHIPPFLSVYGEVATVAVPVVLADYAIRRWVAHNRAAAAADAAKGPAPARLLARVPAALGAEILALEAEDHYVRVHTARGSTLILMRFADAIDELDGMAGVQVHRSWWVARAAVTGASPSGRRAKLVLSNGVTAPVSRAGMREARAAGLLGVRAVPSV